MFASPLFMCGAPRPGRRSPPRNQKRHAEQNHDETELPLPKQYNSHHSMKQHFINFLVVIFVAGSSVGSADDSSLTDYDEYYGNYRFADGSILSGGPMESDRRLVFMEFDRVEDGGVFVHAQGDDFKSQIPSDRRLSFIRNGEGIITSLRYDGGNGVLQSATKSPHQLDHVRFTSGDITLQGNLFTPGGPGPFPGVVLIHGSGDSDRRWGPFATFFLKHGFAVLAYDKRGAGKSEGSWREENLSVLADDAVAGVEYLKTRPDIDAKRIGLFGSSEGGWVAPITATRSDDVTFLIVRVGPGQAPPETILFEVQCRQSTKALSPVGQKATTSMWKEINAAMRAGKSYTEMIETVVEPIRKTDWYQKKYGDSQPLSADWMWSFYQQGADLDPAKFIRNLDIPILWFLAERDENVNTKASIPRLQAAFKDAPGDDMELVVVKNANHAFFVIGPDGQPVGYTKEFFGPMETWLKARILSD
jgi:pimeloyl-ACP methyl ester carboxylesterase